MLTQIAGFLLGGIVAAVVLRKPDVVT
jgi:hypothetical protein